MRAESSRPSANTEAAEDIRGAASESSFSLTADLRTRAKHHGYALLVLAERADGVICSQIYTNLPAAERKVTRTRARGLQASVTLVRLVACASTEAELFGGEIR